MKKLIFRSFLFVLLFAAILAVVSCKSGKDDDEGNTPEPEVFTPTPIETVLNSANNNDAVKVEGVVYGVISNGFYVADSQLGRIFVIKNRNTGDAIAVGDKVQISAEFGYTSNFPQLKNPTITVVSHGNEILVQKEAVKFEDLDSLTKEQRTGAYGKYVTVLGTYFTTTAGFNRLRDDAGKEILLFKSSNVDQLTSFNDERITIDLILHNWNNSESEWQFSFAGSQADVSSTPLSFDELAAKAKAHLDENVHTSVYGVLSVPKSNPLYATLTYTWSVPTNPYLSFENNVATVVSPDSDQEVTATVEVSRGEEKAQFTYTFTLHAIVEKSVSEFLADVPYFNNSPVIVSGVVVGKARNQSLTIRTLIIQDKTTKETTTVEFYSTGNGIKLSDPKFTEIELGDEVSFKGTYRAKVTGDRPTIENVSELTIKTKGNPVEIDTSKALDFSTYEIANEAGINWRDYTGKLVKFTNPFLNYSTSVAPADTNWVKISYDERGDNKYGDEISSRSFAFLIAAQNENVGEWWHTSFEIPYLNTGARQFGLTIYAYMLYISDSYVQFVIPNADCFIVPDEMKVEIAIKQSCELSVEAGSEMTLLKNHDLCGAITWESDNSEVINVETGEVADVTENTTVNLTAKYTINGVEKTLNFAVTVLKSDPLSVDEVLALEDGVRAKFSGIVAGFMADGNAVESRKGIIVLDKTSGKLVFVDGIGALYSTTYPNYVDENGDAIRIGDEVLVKGTFYHSTAAIGSGPNQTSRCRVDVSSKGKVEVLTSKNELKFDHENAIVLDSTEKMDALVSDLDAIPFGQLIKLVGTADAPLYVGGSSSSLPFNMKLYLKPATDNNGTKYNGKTYSLKSDTVAAMVGDDWYQELFGIPGAFVGPSGTNPSKEYVGEMYVVIAYLTGSYYQCQLVDLDGFALLPKDFTIVENYVKEVLMPAATLGKDPVTLPTSSYLTGDLTWESSDNDLFNPTTGVVGTSEETVTVTLTAKFSFGGVAKEVSKELTIEGSAAKPVNVSNVVALTEGGAVFFEGVIAAFASDGNSGETQKGFVVKDLTTGDMIIVSGVGTLLGQTYPAFQDSDSDAAEIGKKVLVKGTLSINNSRKDVNVADGSIDIKEAVTLTFAESDMAVVNNSDQLMALVSDLTKIDFFKVVKIVATNENPLYIGGSGTSAPFNFKVHMKECADNNAVKALDVNSKIIAIKTDVNEPNAGGADWYKTAFPGVTGPFVAPKSGSPALKYTGTMYMMICYTTSTYYQCSVVNYSAWNLTQITE